MCSVFNMKVFNLQEIKGRNNYAECIIAYMLFFFSYNYYIQFILSNFFGIYEKTVPILLFGIGLVASTISYSRMLMNSRKYNTKTGLFLLVFFIIGTMLFFNNYPTVFNSIYTSIADIAYNPLLLLFVYSLPLVFWDTNTIDIELLINICHNLSKILIILFIFAYQVFLMHPLDVELEYMTFSYRVLPAVCFCIAYPSNGIHRVIDIILSLIGTLIIFVSGSRGCSVCVLAFLITYFLFIKKISVRLFSFFAILVICIFFIDVPSLLFKSVVFLEKFDIQSRTILHIIEGNFDQSSGRDMLANKVVEGIYNSPFIGYGVWGDRALLNGSYSHNIVLDMFCSYGIIVGGFIFLFLLYKIGVSLIFLSNSKRKILLCCSIPFGLIHLFFSGSYLNNPWFFFLLAQLMTISDNKRTYINYKIPYIIKK